MRRRQAAEALSSAERGLRNILAAIEAGVLAPGINERIAELERQRDRARLDLRTIKEEAIDPEEFADFIQCGRDLTDDELIDAFVWQVLVSDDWLMVVLNYDAESGEPARLEAQRVRGEFKWWPVRTESRTEIRTLGAVVLLRIPRG